MPIVNHAASIAPLWGLALAGGASTRLGRDKGTLEYHGVPQARWAFELLAGVCDRVYVSVRPEQRGERPYSTLPLIEDSGSGGPAAGLTAAWALAPHAAWLLLAADMPLIDRALLAKLVSRRRPGAVATAFRHPDGRFEPLCAIWEPGARPALGDRPPEAISLHGILMSADVEVIEAGSDAPRLKSVNTLDDDREIRKALERTDTN